SRGPRPVEHRGQARTGAPGGPEPGRFDPPSRRRGPGGRGPAVSDCRRDLLTLCESSMTASNLFRRVPAPFGQASAPQTPFQAAEAVWDARIGSARVQAASWRYAAFASFAVALVAVG